MMANAYALSVILSAFLLFQIQPMIGKVILPWFGGTSAVWSTVLLFFQCVLTGGYAYAYWLLGRLRGRRQGIVHLIFLAISLGLLGITALTWTSPLTPDAAWRPADSTLPVWGILRLLAVAVGVPYFLLASNSTLMQAWFGQEQRARTPYRLYALSNAGSLAALISYPLVFEPLLTLRAQAFLWTAGYAVFAVSAAALALRAYRRAPAVAEASHGDSKEGEARPGLGLHLLWAGLAAVASVTADLGDESDHARGGRRPVPVGRPAVDLPADLHSGILGRARILAASLPDRLLRARLRQRVDAGEIPPVRHPDPDADLRRAAVRGVDDLPLRAVWAASARALPAIVLSDGSRRRGAGRYLRQPGRTVRLPLRLLGAAVGGRRLRCAADGRDLSGAPGIATASTQDGRAERCTGAKAPAGHPRIGGVVAAAERTGGRLDGRVCLEHARRAARILRCAAGVGDPYRGAGPPRLSAHPRPDGARVSSSRLPSCAMCRRPTTRRPAGSGWRC